MLTERQMLVLEAIVRVYTEVGQPVGSKSVVDFLPMHVSSATIRNEMVALENKGLIKKTHSSSGRIPSFLGYRYYVDHIVQPGVVPAAELVNIQNSLGVHFQKIDEIFAESTKILSDLTNYTAISLRPETTESRLEGFRLVPLGNHRIMAILVMSSGVVENQTFSIPKSINGSDLEAVTRLLNDQLIGLSLAEISMKLRTSIPVMLVDYMRRPDGILDVFGNILKQAAREQVFVGGKSNILDFATDSNVDELKSLYDLVDTSNNQNIGDLIGIQGKPIQIKIGEELTNQLLDNYSLISASYDVSDHGQGVIALLGPTNMPYSKMIGLLDAFSDELAKKLLDYYQQFDK